MKKPKLPVTFEAWCATVNGNPAPSYEPARVKARVLLVFFTRDEAANHCHGGTPVKVRVTIEEATDGR